ncbi:NAD-dependent epimerase/dehydratase family protein [Celeribacter indicus]|uniref:NAD-dependent epimerase/dehydratase domain-containing protein n=1 Tax=Celeribacter indicus TaxID=1208324 RepID=A0A0B5DQ29_9RHOB|nr:NAD-dependent epimerase/dehydratase family protein [Celeribacter indicus]AJE45229.1 hypothetical protein P73_0514 [Celeribacter indicus]SDX45771.1 Nucleoside-diphosphate-sugar epimerase [Celeribacter indicus]
MDEGQAVYIGASGRIGTLLRAVARRVPADASPMLWQFRRPQARGLAHVLWPDLAEVAPLVALCRDRPVRTLFVFAGGTGSADRTDAAAMAANVHLTEAAISAAEAAGIPRVVVASSAAVYGAGRGRAFREDDACAPLDAYGHAKAEMERRCAERAARSGQEICCLRIGNVAGADMLLGSATRHPPGAPPLWLDIYPDGDGPRRSYIGPQSLLRVLLALHRAPGPLPAVLNLAAPHPVGMKALLAAAVVPWRPRPQTDATRQDITLDCGRLTALLPSVGIAASAGAICGEWREAAGKAG